MKKLMVFAAIAAAMSGSVFAGICDEAPAGKTGCALYNVKFTLKTLMSKCLTYKDGCAKTNAIVGYFEDGTRKFDGIIWACTNTCSSLTDTQDSAHFVMWEASQKKSVTDALAWDANNNVWTASTTYFAVLDRYSKKANKVEAYWEIPESTFTNATDTGASLTAAGFGTYNSKLAVVSSVCGSAVGRIVPIPVTKGGDECGDKCIGEVVGLCYNFKSWTDVASDANVTPPATVAASGTWCMKYNASLSNGSKRLDQIVPSYAQR